MAPPKALVAAVLGLLAWSGTAAGTGECAGLNSDCVDDDCTALAGYEVINKVTAATFHATKGAATCIYKEQFKDHTGYDLDLTGMDSLKIIETHAFKNNRYSLQIKGLPALEEIKDSAFENALDSGFDTDFAAVKIGGLFPKLKKIGNRAFMNVVSRSTAASGKHFIEFNNLDLLETVGDKAFFNTFNVDTQASAGDETFLGQLGFGGDFPKLQTFGCQTFSVVNCPTCLLKPAVNFGVGLPSLTRFEPTTCAIADQNKVFVNIDPRPLFWEDFPALTQDYTNNGGWTVSKLDWTTATTGQCAFEDGKPNKCTDAAGNPQICAAAADPDDSGQLDGNAQKLTVSNGAADNTDAATCISTDWSSTDDVVATNMPNLLYIEWDSLSSQTATRVLKISLGKLRRIGEKAFKYSLHKIGNKIEFGDLPMLRTVAAGAFYQALQLSAPNYNAPGGPKLVFEGITGLAYIGQQAFASDYTAEDTNKEKVKIKFELGLPILRSFDKPGYQSETLAAPNSVFKGVNPRPMYWKDFINLIESYEERDENGDSRFIVHKTKNGADESQCTAEHGEPSAITTTDGAMLSHTGSVQGNGDWTPDNADTATCVPEKYVCSSDFAGGHCDGTRTPELGSKNNPNDYNLPNVRYIEKMAFFHGLSWQKKTSIRGLKKLQRIEHAAFAFWGQTLGGALDSFEGARLADFNNLHNLEVVAREAFYSAGANIFITSTPVAKTGNDGKLIQFTGDFPNLKKIDCLAFFQSDPGTDQEFNPNIEVKFPTGLPELEQLDSRDCGTNNQGNVFQNVDPRPLYWSDFPKLRSAAYDGTENAYKEKTQTNLVLRAELIQCQAESGLTKSDGLPASGTHHIVAVFDTDNNRIQNENEATCIKNDQFAGTAGSTYSGGSLVVDQGMPNLEIIEYQAFRDFHGGDPADPKKLVFKGPFPKLKRIEASAFWEAAAGHADSKIVIEDANSLALVGQSAFLNVNVQAHPSYRAKGTFAFRGEFRNLIRIQCAAFQMNIFAPAGGDADAQNAITNSYGDGKYELDFPFGLPNLRWMDECDSDDSTNKIFTWYRQPAGTDPVPALADVRPLFWDDFIMLQHEYKNLEPKFTLKSREDPNTGAYNPQCEWESVDYAARGSAVSAEESKALELNAQGTAPENRDEATCVAYQAFCTHGDDCTYNRNLNAALVIDGLPKLRYFERESFYYFRNKAAKLTVHGEFPELITIQDGAFFSNDADDDAGGSKANAIYRIGLGCTTFTAEPATFSDCQGLPKLQSIHQSAFSTPRCDGTMVVKGKFENLKLIMLEALFSSDTCDPPNVEVTFPHGLPQLKFIGKEPDIDSYYVTYSVSPSFNSMPALCGTYPNLADMQAFFEGETDSCYVNVDIGPQFKLCKNGQTPINPVCGSAEEPKRKRAEDDTLTDAEAAYIALGILWGGTAITCWGCAMNLCRGKEEPSYSRVSGQAQVQIQTTKV